MAVGHENKSIPFFRVRPRGPLQLQQISLVGPFIQFLITKGPKKTVRRLLPHSFVTVLIKKILRQNLFQIVNFYLILATYVEFKVKKNKKFKLEN